MHSIASVNRQLFDSRQVLFMSLTYHNHWPEDPDAQYDHLRRWFKRMSRRYPGLVMHWRKEWQGRLAPHWHLILYTPPEAIPTEGTNWTFIEDSVTQWLELACTRFDSRFHMYLHAVDARLCEDWNHAIAYASKTEQYVSKSEKLLPVNDQGEVLPTGRLWGTLGNRKNLPVQFDTRKLTYEQYLRARRVLRRLLRPQNGRQKRSGVPRGDLTNLKALMRYETSVRLLEWLC